MDRQFSTEWGRGGIANTHAWACAAEAATIQTGFDTVEHACSQQLAPEHAEAMAAQAEIGALFRGIRRVLGISAVEMALRINTRLHVISALEAGDLDRLPEWPETVRVVTAFTGLAQIDAKPVLVLMQMGLARPAPSAADGRQEQGQKQKQGEPPETDPEADEPRPRVSLVQPVADAYLIAREALSTINIESIFDRADRAANAALTVLRANARRTAVLVAALFFSVAIFGQGSSLQASLATLHPPIVNLMRSAQDYLLERGAPVRDGLRWIEVDDPRSRRADKLVSN